MAKTLLELTEEEYGVLVTALEAEAAEDTNGDAYREQVSALLERVRAL